MFNYYYDSIPILSEGEIKLRDDLGSIHLIFW